jgi:hypothetical protein
MSVLENFNYNALPQYFLDLKDMAYPKQIANFFNLYDIRRYLYQITVYNRQLNDYVILKYGISHAEANGKKYKGDRVYSQLGGLKSFAQPLERTSSQEFRTEVAEAYRLAYNSELDHNDIILNVLDFTDFKFQFVDKKFEMERHEAEILRRHLSLGYKKPIGNKVINLGILTKTAVSTAVYNYLFDC